MAAASAAVRRAWGMPRLSTPDHRDREVRTSRPDGRIVTFGVGNAHQAKRPVFA